VNHPPPSSFLLKTPQVYFIVVLPSDPMLPPVWFPFERLRFPFHNLPTPRASSRLSRRPSFPPSFFLLHGICLTVAVWRSSDGLDTPFSARSSCKPYTPPPMRVQHHSQHLSFPCYPPSPGVCVLPVDRKDSPPRDFDAPPSSSDENLVDVTPRTDFCPDRTISFAPAAFLTDSLTGRQQAISMRENVS